MWVTLFLVLAAGCTTGRSTTNTSPSASTSVSPGLSPWVDLSFPIGAVGNGGSVNVMALDRKAVYALYQPTTKQGPGTADLLSTMLARIDRTTGAVATAGPFPGALGLAAAGGWLWVAGSYYPGHPEAGFLDRVDPVSLSVGRRVPLPHYSGGAGMYATLAGSGTTLWMGFGSGLYRLSSVDGQTIISRQIGADGVAVSLSLDPSGGTLYLGVNRYSSSGPTVYEWGALDGSLLASSSASDGQGLGGVRVAASTDGVWTSFATGMMGQSQHLSARDLQPLPTFFEMRHTNGIAVFLANGVLWLTDGMTDELTCADPQTGATRARTTLRFGGVVIGDSRAVYVGGYGGVLLLRPDPACSS
jgi:hypothetical protein